MPKHELLPIDKIQVQDGYNDLIRTKKEVTANATEVAEFMEQSDDDPNLFPIKYVKGEDGTLYTRNHATLQAAGIRKWPKILAIESPHKLGSTADLLDLLMSNNQGHPIGRVAQGKLYKSLFEGEKAADWTDENQTWNRPPMTTKEIAESCKPVYTEQHVKDCMTLFTSPDEIRVMIETEQISPNIVITAKQWAKDDQAKWIRILKAAIRNADGVKATKKHMDAIKADFVVLKAAGGEDAPEKTTKPKGKNAPPTDLSLEPTDSGATAETPQKNLFEDAPEDDLLKEGSKKNTKIKAALATRFLDTDGLEKIGVTISLTNEEADALAKDVMAIVANLNTVF